MEKEIDVDGENFGHCSVRSGHGMSMSQETFLMALASRGLISGSAFLFKLKVGFFLIQKKKKKTWVFCFNCFIIYVVPIKTLKVPKQVAQSHSFFAVIPSKKCLQCISAGHAWFKKRITCW